MAYAASDLAPVTLALHRMSILIGSTDQIAITLADGGALHPGLDLLNDAALLRRSADALRSGMFEMLVAGRFKSGKSSLVNALIGAKMSPTGSTPTTAVMTRMIQGDELRIMVQRRLGTCTAIDWETFEQEYTLADNLVADDEAAIAERFADIDYIEVAYPFPLLIAGAAIVDSPGLGENRLRTALALEYIPRAVAIIVVLDAKQPLAADEQAFIALLGIGKLRHVFFVISKLDQIDDASEHTRLREHFTRRLRPHFCDEAGVFDSDLFAQRVFYTNAPQALRAFEQVEPDQTQYVTSGVAELQAALMAYLHGDERRLAGIRALIPTLADILVRVDRSAELRLATLAQPLEVVQQRLHVVDTRLQRLLSFAEELEIRLRRIGEVVQYQVYSDLVRFVDDMDRSWTEDVKRLNLRELQNVNIFTAQFSDADKARIVATLTKQLEDYLQVKLIEWAQRLPVILRPHMETMLRELREDLRSLQIELADLSNTLGTELAPDNDEFAAIFGPTAFQGLISKDVTTRFLRPLVERTLKDLTRDDRFQEIALTVLRTILDVAQLASRGVGRLAALIGSRVIDLIQRRQEIERIQRGRVSLEIDREFSELSSADVDALQDTVRTLLVDQLRTPLFDRIRTLLNERRAQIFASIHTEFAHIGSEFGDLLRQRINELRTAQTHLIAYRSNQHFSINAERTRLDTISRELRNELALLTEMALGFTLTEAQINELAQRRSAFIAQVAETPLPFRVDGVPDLPLPITPVPEANQAVPDAMKEADLISARLQAAISASFGLRGITYTPNDAIAQLSTRLAGLVGLDEVKGRVLELLDYQVERRQRQARGLKVGEPPSLHLVFTGNPGTGKTTVAEIIGEAYQKMGVLKKGHVVKTKRADLVGMWQGHTEQRMREAIDKAIDGVLFIDEAHQLSAVKFAGSTDIGQLAILTLLERMEPLRDRLVVIVAGYPKEMEDFLDVDPGLRRRFPPGNVIYFPDYQPAELFQILETILQERDYALAPGARTAIQQVIAGLYQRRNTTFGNAGAMRDFADRLIISHSKRIRSGAFPDDDPIREQDIDEYYRSFQVKPPEVQTQGTALAAIEAMIGLTAVKAGIRRLKAQAERSHRLGEPLRAESMHMLFHGAPGTGKTTVAEQFAALLYELGYLPTNKLTIAKRADFVGVHIGDTEPKTLKLLERALDGVLFIDEAYDLYVEHSPNDYGRTALSLLNDFMERHRDRLVVILAGYPEELDLMLDANRGLSGRFAAKLNFEDYSNDQLMQIARQMVQHEGYTLTPKVEQRMIAYLDRKRRVEIERFANAREVRMLLNTMKLRQAERLQDEAISDDAEYRRLAYIFEEADIPPPPEAPISTVKVVITDGITRTLPITIQPHAADRSR